MKKSEAIELSNQIQTAVSMAQCKEAVKILMPTLQAKTSFSMLDFLATCLYDSVRKNTALYLTFFDELAATHEMAAYVIIGKSLTALLSTNYNLAFQKAKEYIIQGNEWYVCDTIGERVLGQALIDLTDDVLPLFTTFSQDESPWIRRSVGVAVHFFTKRCRDSVETIPALLSLLESLLPERDQRVIKGVGWGLKTIGRFHPDLLADFMVKKSSEVKISATILRKCLTYLPDEHKTTIQAAYHL